MKALPVILCLTLCACETVIYHPVTGKPIIRTYSDINKLDVELKGNNLSVTADSINNSRPAAANWHGATTFITGAGAGVATYVVASHGGNVILPVLGTAAATTLKPAPPVTGTPTPKPKHKPVAKTK
jgi:hypothetical protein